MSRGLCKHVLCVKNLHHPAREPLISIPLPSHPWERITSNLFQLKVIFNCTHLLIGHIWLLYLHNETEYIPARLFDFKEGKGYCSLLKVHHIVVQIKLYTKYCEASACWYIDKSHSTLCISVGSIYTDTISQLATMIYHCGDYIPLQEISQS